jgi:hypothetical protein
MVLLAVRQAIAFSDSGPVRFLYSEMISCRSYYIPYYTEIWVYLGYRPAAPLTFLTTATTSHQCLGELVPPRLPIHALRQACRPKNREKCTLIYHIDTSKYRQVLLRVASITTPPHVDRKHFGVLKHSKHYLYSLAKQSITVATRSTE